MATTGAVISRNAAPALDANQCGARRNPWKVEETRPSTRLGPVVFVVPSVVSAVMNLSPPHHARPNGPYPRLRRIIVAPPSSGPAGCA